MIQLTGGKGLARFNARQGGRHRQTGKLDFAVNCLLRFIDDDKLSYFGIPFI